jgi:aspartate racemase
MPKEVCKMINNNSNIHKVGLMATLGTIKSGVYERYLKKELYCGDERINDAVTDLIYNKVKKGVKVSQKEFYDVVNKYFEQGCDVVIMGCTELSVIMHDNDLYHDNRIIDSMKVLVDKTIELAKK